MNPESIKRIYHGDKLVYEAVPAITSLTPDPKTYTAGTIHTASTSNDILNALIAAGPGDIIECNPGKYAKISRTTTLNKSNVTIRPKDKNNPPVWQGSGFVFNNVSGVTLDGLHFKSTAKDAEGYPTGTGVRLENYKNITVRNCWFDGYMVQLDVQRGTNIIIEWSSFTGCGMDSIRVFRTNTNVTIRHVEIKNARVNDARAHESNRHPDCIQFACDGNADPSSNVVIEDNVIYGRNDGDGYRQMLFMGNGRVRADAPIAQAGYRRFVVRRNYMEGAHVHGIALEGQIDVLVQGNLLRKFANFSAGHKPTITCIGNQNSGTIDNNVTPDKIGWGRSLDGFKLTRNIISDTAVPVGWVMPKAGPYNGTSPAPNFPGGGSGSSNIPDFAVDDRIELLRASNIRSSATISAATLIGINPKGFRGTLVEGPQSGVQNSQWFKVDFDRGKNNGWVASDNFNKLAANAPIQTTPSYFKVGDKIQLFRSANVRSNTIIEASSLKGVNKKDATGTIKAGPKSGTNNSIWYDIDFDGDSLDGWVVSDNYVIAGVGAGPLPVPVGNHPNTVINAKELAVVRERVLKRQGPQWTAYQALSKDANAGLSFNKTPPKLIVTYPADQTSIARDIFREHSKYAYACALNYQLTGDNRYATKARDIMQKWADIDVYSSSSSAGLHMGSYLVGFMYAYDLLVGYNGWSSANRAKFKSWWYNRILPHCRDVIEGGDPKYVVNNKMVGNDTSKWDPSNWLEAVISCSLATGCAFDDNALRTEMVNRVKKYFINNWRYSYKNYGPGGKKVAVVNGDIDRIKNDSKVIQGIMYTGYGTSSMVQMMEMCRYAGVNVWTYKTPDGINLQQVIEQWWRWNWKNEEFNHYKSQQASGYDLFRKRVNHDNIFELANNHYNMSAEFKTYLKARRPIVNDSPRDEYATLTKGDMPPQ